jgi:dihydrofolate reductase
LPGRTNVVITRQSGYQADGCIVVHDLNSAIQSCPAEENEAFICGGGQLYQEAMSATDRIYLTVLSREVEGDTYFPEISETEFKLSRSDHIDGVEPYEFVVYDRF